MCELIYTGSRMIQSGESPTGWLVRLSASCNQHHRRVEPDGVREIRYECGVSVNPCDGDDVARADFEAMDKLEKYHEEHCIGQMQETR